MTALPVVANLPALQPPDSRVLTNQTIDPSKAADAKPFILVRPFVALWHWLFPPTLAQQDRQSLVARWIAAGLLLVVSITLCVLGFIYAKPIQDAYQDWRAERLVKEARQLVEDGQIANAVFKAQEAVIMAPDNINAIRLNTEFLTLMKRNEAIHFLDRLDKKGATTPADKMVRVRALLNLNRNKEASAVLEDLLSDQPLTDSLMKLAEAVWGERQQGTMLLSVLKKYTAKHPDDRPNLLRLAQVQVESRVPLEISDGMQSLWQLADGDDEAALAAIEYLDRLESLPPDEINHLIERLRGHPKATGWHRVAALKRQLLQNPYRRPMIIQQAIEEARGKSREDLVPMVRFLVEQREYLQILSLVTEQEAMEYQPLLENYLNALTQLQRFDEVERLVNNPKVESILSTSVSAFYRAHLAYVTRKPVEDVRSAIISAKVAAEQEGRGQLVLAVAKYAEERGFQDIAEDGYKAAALLGKMTERDGYQGLIRTTAANGNTEGLIKAAQEATRRWPDDQSYMERYLYANLLAGRELERSLQKVLNLLDSQPRDHQRRLLAALAYWRITDLATAANYLEQTDAAGLTPGQKAVYAAIIRERGTQEAVDTARAVLRTIPPVAKMLPEERACFAKASK